MKIYFNRIFMLSGVVVLTIPILSGGCHSDPGHGKKNLNGEIQGKVPEVSTYRAAAYSFEKAVMAYGSLAPYEQSVIGVEVSGKLDGISVDIGTIVEKGDEMAVMDRSDYLFKLHQVESLLKQALARLGLSDDDQRKQIRLEETSPVMRADAVLQEKLRDLDRAESLFNDGVVSQSEIESAKTDYDIAMNQYQEALNEARTRLAQLEQRRAELDMAKQALTNTSIRAPFKGTIQRRYAYVGEYLNVGDPLVSLVRTDVLRLQLQVAEKDIVWIENGQKVKVQVTGQTDTWNGEVKRISPQLNESTRMLLIEAEVVNNGTLRAGQHAVSQIVINQNDNHIGIPENCIVRFAGIEKVVCVENNLAIEKKVTTGRKQNGMVEIISGINDGEYVIVLPGSIRSGEVKVRTDT